LLLFLPILCVILPLLSYILECGRFLNQKCFDVGTNVYVGMYV
jgi:hypothetical protein